MGIKKISIALLALVFLVSCKKEKLEGDKSILVGTWKWVNSQKVTNTCEAENLWNYTYTDSAENNNEYSLEFLEKGKVKFYTNTNLLWKHRIVFEGSEDVSGSSYSKKYTIALDNNSLNTMVVYVGNDSLMLDDFPKDTDNACETMHNHFIRE